MVEEVGCRDARRSQLLGHSLEADDLVHGHSAAGPHVGQTEDVLAAVAGLQQVVLDAAGSEQPPGDLRRAELVPAAQVLRRARMRGQVQHGRAPATDGEAELGVELRHPAGYRSVRLGQQGLERRPVDVGAESSVHVVVHQRRAGDRLGQLLCGASRHRRPCVPARRRRGPRAAGAPRA